MKLTIGIVNEGKNPPDFRVPLTPYDCKEIMEQFPGVCVKVQSSKARCYTDKEYTDLGITVTDTVADCDVLAGVKEVPIQDLLPGKTYFFFSHTIKKQVYNQALMHALIANGIRMVDYELLTDASGNRLIGFGYYAGLVGAHNGLLSYGSKTRTYQLQAAYTYDSVEAITDHYKQILFPAFKIAVTGSGQVAKGAWHIMEKAGIEEVSVEAYLYDTFSQPVFVKLFSKDLYQDATASFDRNSFYQQPELYTSNFNRFIPHTDILINGIFWNERIPRLFEKEALTRPDFNIRTIADITCDINGSVPINAGASTIPDPVYGIDRSTYAKTTPFVANSTTVDVMAVDNLPNELPRDASAYFGRKFREVILPELMNEESDILDRATICKNGRLNPGFEYLHDYAYNLTD